MTSTIHTAVLSVAVPSGCMPVETIQVVGADGLPVLSVVAVPTRDTATQVAGTHRPQLEGTFAGLVLDELTTIAGDRGEVLLARGRTPADAGGALTAVRAAYVVEGGWAYVAVATRMVGSGDHDSDGDVTDRLEELVLGAVPPPVGASPDAVLAFTTPPERRNEPVASDWHDATSAWARDGAAPLAASPARVVTLETIAAAAAMAGAKTAAGVDMGLIARWEPSIRHAVLASAARGLVACGAAVRGAGPGLAGVQLVDPTLTVLFDHDLLVELAVTACNVTRRVTFAVRPDTAMRIEPGDADRGLGELVSITPLAVESLARGITDAIGLTDTATAGGQCAWLPSEVVIAALRQGSDVTTATRRLAAQGHDLSAAATALVAALATTTLCASVRSVYRRDGAIVGGDLWLAAGPDGVVHLEVVDEHTVRATTVSSRDVLGAVLTLLPGGSGDRITEERLRTTTNTHAAAAVEERS